MKIVNEYKHICNSSKYFINKYRNINFLRINPSLFVIRKHPEDWKKYKSIININIFEIIFKFFKFFIIYFFYEIGNILKDKDILINNCKINKNTNYQNIFISHLINEKQLYEKNDFYFNNLPAIASKKYKTLLILINHTKINFKNHKKIFKKNNYDIYILTKRINLIESIFLFYQSLIAIAIILKDIIFNFNNIKKNILLFTLSRIFHPNSLFVNKFFIKIKKIIKLYKPNNVFFTYEGYSWERSVCIAANENEKKINCIAYQHSRLFKNQYSVMQKYGFNMDPNIILTKGNINKKILQSKIKSIKIINIGKSLFKQKPKIKKYDLLKLNKKKIICVIPEVFFGECYKLFKFSIDCAYADEKNYFIWRFHPLTNKLKVLNEIRKKYTIPKNIIISNKSLQNDLIKSDLILYRGSTAILDGLRHGIISIYLKTKDNIDIDLLNNEYNCNLHSHSPDDFLMKINKLFKSPTKIKLLQKRSLKFYKDYYSLFDEKKFKILLN